MWKETVERSQVISRFWDNRSKRKKNKQNKSSQDGDNFDRHRHQGEIETHPTSVKKEKRGKIAVQKKKEKQNPHRLVVYQNLNGTSSLLNTVLKTHTLSAPFNQTRGYIPLVADFH